MSVEPLPPKVSITTPESFDYAAKIVTDADRQALLANPGERAAKRMSNPRFVQMLLNNSGNYPHEKRVPCDTHTIGIMLQCAPCDLLDYVIQEMTERIKAQVVPKLDKTDRLCILNVLDKHLSHLETTLRQEASGFYRFYLISYLMPPSQGAKFFLAGDHRIEL